ncbi:katanin p60 ATPase-containing subunit A-like 2 [Symsagittifera roscoffensis]|uniref:katanin p60 ATPase-containing subunit A-like 2 n=1 Tax=Symsagittifera roscoffensis TaxID=84072 RepID=UPI00307B40CB
MATAEMNYMSLRSANQAREAEETKADQRRKNVIILMHDYLRNSGFTSTASSLASETNLPLDTFEVADNVDLETILQEYESYYFVKFQRHPRIIRKNGANQSDDKSSAHKRPTPKRSYTTNQSSLPKIDQNRPSTGGATGQSSNGPQSSNATPQKTLSEKKTSAGTIKRSSPKDDTKSNTSDSSSTANSVNNFSGLSVQGVTAKNEPQTGRAKAGQIIDYRALLKDAIFGDGQHENPNPNGANKNFFTDVMTKKTSADYEDKFLKPVGALAGYNSEMRELAVSISKDIYLESTNVKFDDIIGLDNAKKLVKEAVVYPIKYPELFQGILSPWKGLLLYGPPGTGKTLLAKAVASECNTTFFNISASSIVSKWRGDSEKLVRVLFDLARFHAPSTIFVDELESLISQRGEGFGTEHEGSRRMKTELLVQMDGLARSDDLVFLLAASNLPWMLDHAMLRRLEKRILVDLPIAEARDSMFQKFLPTLLNDRASHSCLKLHTNLDYQELAEKSEGYSGSDIRLVCKEAAMDKVRDIFDVLENCQSAKDLPQTLSLKTITTEDVLQALEKTKPSAKGLKSKYDAWETQFQSI